MSNLDEQREARETIARLSGTLSALEQGLIYARKWYQKGDDNGRLGAFTALWAVIDFLQAFDDFHSAGLERPLVSLATALLDVDKGTVHPMLRPKRGRKRGQSPSTIEMTRFRVMAAVAMTLFMKNGSPKNLAAQRVARALDNAGFKRAGGRPITAQTVAGWRDRVSGGLPTESDTASYRYVLTAVQTRSVPPERQAENLLKAIKARRLFSHLAAAHASAGDDDDGNR